MKPNNSIENVLGTIGTVFWSGQIIPQIWKSWHEKSTQGLSPLLMLIWATSATFIGVYNIVQDINIPLIVQPQLFGGLAATSWAQCLYYSKARSARDSILILLAYLSVFAAFEAGMTYAARSLKDHHPEPGKRFIQVFGYMSPILITLGLVPQYWEIFQLKEVIGISLLFMTIDMLGAFFSFMSLIYRDHFDVIASITYLAVLVFDGGIVLLSFILNPRAKRKRLALELNSGNPVDPEIGAVVPSEMPSVSDPITEVVDSNGESEKAGEKIYTSTSPPDQQTSGPSEKVNTPVGV